MLIYFIVLAIVSVAAMPLKRARFRRIDAFLYAVIGLALVCLAGLRSRSVGTDAGNYVAMFDRQQDLAGAFGEKLEPGFYVLSWVAHLFSDDYVSLFLVVAAVVTACFTWTISRCSGLPWMSFFVFVVSGAFAVSINGARQGLAIAIVFLGYRALLRRKFWWFATCVAVASLFHVTAIVALLAYPLVAGTNRFRTRLTILVLGGAGIAAFDSLIDLAGRVEGRFAVYGEAATEGRGVLVLGFLVALCVFFSVFRRAVQTHGAAYDILLDLFILGTVIAAVATWQGTGASGIRRLSLYFLASEILLWPLVFLEARDPFNRAALLLAFCAAYLAYFGLTLRAFSNLVPYTLNPIVYEWMPFL